MQRPLDYLYNRFLTGMKPTQQDFQDLMDSFFHKADLDAALTRLEQISLGEGEAWQVDAALDEGSVQPVQNKVVAARLRQLAESLETTNSNLSSAARTLAEAVEAIGTKASQNDLNNLTSGFTTFVSEVRTALSSKADASSTYTKSDVDAALRDKSDKTDTYTKQEVDRLSELKMSIAQGIANAGKVPKVNEQGNLELSSTESIRETVLPPNKRRVYWKARGCLKTIQQIFRQLEDN